MCFRYEDEYGKCWDYLFFDIDGSVLEALDSVGAEVADEVAFKKKMLNTFEQLHRDGIILPKSGKQCPGIKYSTT